MPFTSASMSSPDIFTVTTVYALAAVIGIGVIAKIGSDVLLPKNASSKDRFTFIWLVCIFPSLHSLLLIWHRTGFRRHGSL